MTLMLIAVLAASNSWAAKINPADDFARRQKLQQSANAWFEREAAPRVLGSLRQIDSYGVSVREKSVVLPPDLGGPLPNRPVTLVLEVSVSGYGYDRHGARNVECRFKQSLLANTNSRGQPESIRPGQPFRGPLACASGYFPNPRDYGRQAW